MANNRIVYFEPNNVELKGIVTKITFPGPPNYESIENGDKKETYDFLILENPINVDFSPSQKKIKNDDTTNVPTNNVKVLELVVVSGFSDWKKLEKGNVVQITGELFSAFSGQHHTRVLLTAKEVKVISKGVHIYNQAILQKERADFDLTGPK